MDEIRSIKANFFIVICVILIKNVNTSTPGEENYILQNSSFLDFNLLKIVKQVNNNRLLNACGDDQCKCEALLIELAGEWQGKKLFIVIVIAVN